MTRRGFNLSKIFRPNSAVVTAAFFIPIGFLQQIIHLRRLGLIRLPSDVSILERQLRKIKSRSSQLEQFLGSRTLSQHPKLPTVFRPIVTKTENDIVLLSRFVNASGENAIELLKKSERISDQLVENIFYPLYSPHRLKYQKIKSFAHKLIAWNGAIRLKIGILKHVSILKDYSFDLSDQLARTVFNSTVTGLTKIAIKQSTSKITNFLHPSTNHYDLTITENIALKRSRQVRSGNCYE